MEMLILPVLIIFFPRNGLLDKPICGESKFLSSTIRGQVTLSIDETEFQYINWLTTDGKFLAKTSPGKPAQIRQAEYEGKLKATADGSLIIMNLSREDQNHYTANVQTIASGQCLQRFHLQVFDALSTESCAGQTNVSSEEGAEVTLPVNQTSFESITWVTLWDLVHFAVTKPGQSVVIQDPRYEGRLNATSNGALIITGLTREDQGTYGAYVVTPTSQQCAQLYNLRVTGALSVESCSGQTNISSEEGAEVTLSVSQTGFVSITWVTLRDLVHFAVTEPGQPVVIQDPRYQGRLNATANGSLIITGLTREDQGTYGAYVVTPTSQQCAQLYNLRVTGFYQEKTHMDYTTENTIRLAISGCVVLITCFVLIHHMKTEVMSSSTDTHEHQRCTKVL